MAVDVSGGDVVESAGDPVAGDDFVASSEAEAAGPDDGAGEGLVDGEDVDFAAGALPFGGGDGVGELLCGFAAEAGEAGDRDIAPPCREDVCLGLVEDVDVGV